MSRSEWALAITVVLMVGLLVHPYRAQQASRYALTAAIVERGTVSLDDYEDVLGRDRAVRAGHIYSDKGPGQPVLAVPFFALGKAVGVEDATTLRIERNLGLWWVTLWSSALPAAALAVMMYRRTSSVRCRGALFATVATYAGTILLPLSALLFGHVLAATLLFASYMLLSAEARVRHVVVSGLLAGLAVTVEYTTVGGVLMLGIYAAARHRSAVLSWVAGGIPVALALALYNTGAFGDPFTLSYQYTAFSEVTETGREVFAMFRPAPLENAAKLLFHGRGFLIATPVVVVGIASAVVEVRRRLEPEAIMALAMVLAFLWIPLLWANPWGGDSPGARYMTPALPFLALPILWSRIRWPRLTLLAAGVSVFTMMVATFTNPLLPRDTVDGLNRWLRQLLAGDVVDSIPGMFAGGLGWLLHLLVIAVAVTAAVRSHRRRCSDAG